MSNEGTTVTMNGRSVTLTVPDAWAWYRVTTSMRPYAEVSLVLLRLCWSGPGRPKGSDAPEDVEAHGQAVFRDLHARGVPAREIRAAALAAWALCDRAYGSNPGEAETAADFSGAADGSSESS